MVALIIVAYSHPAHSTNMILCDEIEEGERFVVRENTQLQRDCVVKPNVTFVIDRSNVDFDCNYSRMAGSKATAIEVKSDNGIRDISVRRCRIDGYNHALRIRQATVAYERYSAGDTNPDELRQRAPSNIRIENFRSINTNYSGVFIDDHVAHVTLDDLIVTKSGTTGIYLEFGTQYITIENSRFQLNGREAIAIDSSSYNTIKNNRFESNRSGSIFLYRNCWEGKSDLVKKNNYFPRTQGSNLNNIIGNEFVNEKVGVWVASRQSRDLASLDCVSYLMASNNGKKYHLDLANRNRILGNNFVDVETGINVEDDDARIFGNSFSSSVALPIIVGTKWRSNIYNSPITGHSIAFNTFFRRGSSMSNLVRYVEGSTNRVECSNIGKDNYGNRYLLNHLCTQNYKNIVTEDGMFIIENQYSNDFLSRYYH